MGFAESLFAAARPHNIETHPFVIRIREGLLTREEIASFALHIASSTASFVRALHAILSICPNPIVRHSLIANVLEEEGMTTYIPGQAQFDPDRHHPTMARRFARAAGVTDEQIDSFVIGPPRWFHRALAAGNWLGPFAYIAVGTEAHTPPTFRLIAPPLRQHYGFTEGDLEFLYEHMTADDRHGEEGARLIASVATTDEARRQALEGARRGGSGWWQILLKHAGTRSIAA
ncbi:MAG TPA: iron-containing redox enzyme family protein [Thermoanaerobaculia bacterium]|nr:iron-containing redox enzyme family protein [Thermoanaerobaculia bacterium]